MAFFLARVELHGADEKDYESLHAHMSRAGFRRTLTFDETTYELPPAEYILQSDILVDAVLNTVKYAAAQTGLNHGVLVSNVTQCRQFGLVPDDIANTRRSLRRMHDATPKE